MLRFLWGWNFCLFFIDRKEVSERFLKIAYRFTLGISLFLAFFYFSKEAQVFENLTKLWVILFVNLLAVFYLIWKNRLLRVFSLLGFLAIMGFVFYRLDFKYGLNFLSSSLILGTVFMGQFLGHWFLNVPNIHIRELKRIIVLMLLSFLLKFLLVFAELFFIGNRSFKVQGLLTDGGEKLFQFQEQFGDGLFSIVGSLPWSLGVFGMLLLVARILWGLLAPIYLSYLCLKTVQIRSTQSATGILYAMSVMVLVGEGCVLYILYSLNWYL